MRLQKQSIRFMKKRHAIYLARKAGKELHWTTNSILRERMFCNVYRELDWTTDFMRKNITKPNEAAPPDLMLFNCAYFRYIGDSALFGHGGLQRFIEDFPSVRASLKQKIRRALDDRMKVFTSAYRIVHSGKSTPKEVYVVDIVLASLWEHRKLVAQIGVQSNSLQETFKALFKLRGFGGTGFMAYEV